MCLCFVIRERYFCAEALSTKFTRKIFTGGDAVSLHVLLVILLVIKGSAANFAFEELFAEREEKIGFENLKYVKNSKYKNTFKIPKKTLKIQIPKKTLKKTHPVCNFMCIFSPLLYKNL